MASVARGSKLVVRAGGVAVSMRALRAVEVSGSGWALPVLADLAELDGLIAATAPGKPAVLESGSLRVAVEIVATSGDLMLRPPRKRPSRAIRPAALTDQRRENVRGPVHLEFRGTVMPQPAPAARAGRRGPLNRRPVQPGLLAARGPGRDAQADLVGRTASISAGGIRVGLTEGEVTVGATVYGEVTLPDGDLVPALMVVLELTGDGFRAEFSDISPMDGERLVRLVFHRERGELAERR